MDKEKLDAFKAYLQEEELSENSIESYLFSVSSFFQKYKVADKTSLIQWKQELMKQNSPKTVNLRLCAMERWLKFDDSKIGKIKRVRYQKSTTVENAMDIENYNKLIKGLEQDANYKWIAYYKLLALTGARISEALCLTKGDLDRGFAELFTKGKIRRIYIPQKLLEEHRGVWKNLSPDDHLITNKYGKKMTSRGIAAMMQSHAIKYDIPKEKMHPHAFRHLFAIEFLKRNKDISLLADLMGHSGVNTTMIYTRRSEKEQKELFNSTVDW